jgi:maltose O-acetyltransferase
MSIRRAANSLLNDVILNSWIAARFIPRGLRWRLLRGYGLNVARSTISAGGFYGSRRITIREGAFLNHNVFLDGAAAVTIGIRARIGPGVMVITGSHEIGSPEQRAGDDYQAPVTIGDGVWVGAKAIILPGVFIGSGCVIAAGSVVTKDCEANALYAGVPAAKVRMLDGEDHLAAPTTSSIRDSLS